MKPNTAECWALQHRHGSDREELFAAVAAYIGPSAVPYPGSWVDVTASFVFESVTYVDNDARARRFFDDADGVTEILEAHRGVGPAPTVTFIPSDYRDRLDLEAGSFDLLVSLYAGFVSEACTRYLRPGGHLLVNTSHGDVGIAALDPRYRIRAVLDRRGSGGYRVIVDSPERFLIPKRPQDHTVERLHALGRGVAYTRPAAFYLFQRVDEQGADPS